MQSLNPTTANPLKLGTRASPLAMAQALNVEKMLRQTHNLPEGAIKIVTMKTTGDQFTDRPLSAIGGKGLFTKELEIGLYNKEIDFAVHSMKDVATILPDGLEISTVLAREDVRDALIGEGVARLEDIAQGARVGTSSLRRRAQLLAKRPDLDVVEFRGTVETRLQKLRDGLAEATFLAMAGLNRLERSDLFENDWARPLDIETMLPAAAQAAIGIEIREEDYALRDFLLPLNDEATHKAITIERAFLRVLDGSCRTPIAAFFDGKTLRGEVLSLDGMKRLSGEWLENHNEAKEPVSPLELGKIAGEEMLSQGAADVLQ